MLHKTSGQLQWQRRRLDEVEGGRGGLQRRGTSRLARATAGGSKARAEIREDMVVDEEERKRRLVFCTLLKTRTSGESRNIIMGVPRDNGYEAWRSLCIRYEPHAGIRRMKEIAELNQLLNKRI